MNIHKFIVILFAFLIGFNSFSQTRRQRKGEDLFKVYSYAESIQKYEAITDKNTEINRKLAESYYNIGKFGKSEDYWALVVASSDKTADDVYRYASVLAMNKKYKESEKWMKEFNHLASNDRRGILWANNSGFYEKLQKDKGRFKIESLYINTEQEDFGTAYFKDKIVFASTRQALEAVKRRWNWNDLPFLDLYEAEIDSNMQVSSYHKFHSKINKKYHEGPASFNQKGDFMVFTRNNYHGRSQEGIIKLQMFTSQFIGGKWKKPVPMPFNSNEYSVGHGSLTPDGKTIYFSSDMPGGYGGVDIYRINRKPDGSWTDPENLGDKINTEGNEMFPFIHTDGLLFFSSDGLLGLGGLDIFLSYIKDDGFSTPENIGAPVNGNYDDFAFILDQKQERGYFSSNRPEGEGDDDIYLFRLLRPFRYGKLIRGTAMEPDSSVLSEVKVNLYDQNQAVIGSITTSKDGKYEFLAEQDKLYSLDGKKPLYTNGFNTADTHTDEYVVIADLFLKRDPQFYLFCLIKDETTDLPLKGVKVTMRDKINNRVEEVYTPESGEFFRLLDDKKLNDSISYDLLLEKEGYLTESFTYKQILDHEGRYDMFEDLGIALTSVEVGIDLSEIIDINPIYFDLNKDNIRPDAAIELDKIVKLMIENPKIEIELGAHTDCRGSATYNMNLSDRRAKSSADYIKKRIPNPERIYGKGYGESRLINHCECEGTRKVPCTDEEHQKNRRTEFRLVKM
jgi:outer membrane protein OmpA-like peptidoglycan-associated protein